MTRLDRYLFSQMLTLFGFFGLVLVLVYWINRAARLFERLISDGHSALVFLELSLLTLPNAIRLVLPVAAFAAAIYAANRLRGESELVVIQAGGVSPARLTRPVALFGLCAGALTLVLTTILTPISVDRLEDRIADLARDVTAGLLTEGTFLHPADDITFYVREVSPGNELLGVFLSDDRETGRSTIYSARRAVLVRSDGGPQLVMFDGTVQRLDTTDDRLSLTRFDELAYDVSALIDMGGDDRRDVDAVATASLFAARPALQDATGRDAARLRLAAHERIAQGLTSAVVPLLGFATLLLGRHSRFGAWRQIVAAVVLLILVELGRNVVMDLATRSGDLWPLVYAPQAAVLITVALILALAGSGPIRRRRGVAP